jgi:hypothetical protein
VLTINNGIVTRAVLYESRGSKLSRISRRAIAFFLGGEASEKKVRVRVWLGHAVLRWDPLWAASQAWRVRGGRWSR